MDAYDGLEIARLFKPLRDALALAVLVCALFFRDELVAVLLYIAQERAQHIVEDLSDIMKIDDGAST